MLSYWLLYLLHRMELRTRTKRQKKLSSDKIYSVSLSCLQVQPYTTRNIRPKGKNISCHTNSFVSSIQEQEI